MNHPKISSISSIVKAKRAGKKWKNMIKKHYDNNTVKTNTKFIYNGELHKVQNESEKLSASDYYYNFRAADLLAKTATLPKPGFTHISLDTNKITMFMGEQRAALGNISSVIKESMLSGFNKMRNLGANTISSIRNKFQDPINVNTNVNTTELQNSVQEQIENSGVGDGIGFLENGGETVAYTVQNGAVEVGNTVQTVTESLPNIPVDNISTTINGENISDVVENIGDFANNAAEAGQVVSEVGGSILKLIFGGGKRRRKRTKKKKRRRKRKSTKKRHRRKSTKKKRRNKRR